MMAVMQRATHSAYSAPAASVQSNRQIRFAASFLIVRMRLSESNERTKIVLPTGRNVRRTYASGILC